MEKYKLRRNNMTFETVGQTGKPMALLIHPMLNDASCFNKFREHLADDYFLILPTLDRHDGKTEFISLQEQVKKINDYLVKQGFTNLDFILGTSLGALVAFRVFQNSNIHVQRLYLDGIPFFKFGRIIKSIVRSQFLRIWRYCNGNPEKAVEKFRKDYDKAAERMVRITRQMSEPSVRNLPDACYSNELVPLDVQEQSKITFFFGSKEPAILCKHRIGKYEKAKIIIFRGYGHCDYLNIHTKSYLDIVTGQSRS